MTPEEQFAEIRAVLAETAELLREHGKQLLTLAKLWEQDEQLDELRARLEALKDQPCSCRGTGRSPLTGGYCPCPCGKDLERVEKRMRADEEDKPWAR